MKKNHKAASNLQNGFLSEGFNQKKSFSVFDTSNLSLLKEMRSLARQQCKGTRPWPHIDIIKAWMLTAETATLMKWGGLGMVASELPENFNNVFGKRGHEVSIVTPMYVGNTGKKSASFSGSVYAGSENTKTSVKKITTVDVPFIAKRSLTRQKVSVYSGKINNVTYILLENEHFFSITPHRDNPSTQDGCYVLNQYGVNEVERFAFFSKAVCLLLEKCQTTEELKFLLPNLLIANDWHSGAVAGLCKYRSKSKLLAGEMAQNTADFLKNIPIVHIAHHLGYQGWDYPNTTRLLNSLYEDQAQTVYKNAKAVKNSNPRTSNTLIVYDCYNQASCNFHLADRVVTVSKNYVEEVSKELCFGHDFRDILKIRKNSRTFFGIVNGYEKKLIAPNQKKIDQINAYFGDFKFKVYNEHMLSNKLNNKKECIKLLSKIATSETYKKQIIDLIDIYNFNDISDLESKAEKIPFICATSRLVEQKGYDTAAAAIVNLISRHLDKKIEQPICVLGGAGDPEQYRILQNLKNELQKISPEAARRVFVFRGYRDEFAYALQLAADFYLMPSRFEPCGLTQMEAMAKGCLPIAMSTGGLVDTITDGQDGFRTDVFFADGHRVYGSNAKAQKLKNNVNAYAEALSKALRCFYLTPNTLHLMTVNAMKQDFSWSVDNGSVYKYYNLFKNGTP